MIATCLFCSEITMWIQLAWYANSYNVIGDFFFIIDDQEM